MEFYHIGQLIDTGFGFRMDQEKIMSNRRRLARERLEVVLVRLILAYRLFILIAGLLLLVYAIVPFFIHSLAGNVSLLPAIFLLLLGNIL